MHARVHRLVLTVAGMVAVVASGCGDNRSPGVDAAVIDAMSDAAVDGPFDAAVLDAAIDAPLDAVTDAAVIDAVVDAMIDAAIDASAIDAAVIDAAVIDAAIDATAVDAAVIDAAIDATAIDAAVIDAAIDATAVDAAIDALAIDAPPAVCELPTTPITCVVGNNAPCLAVCSIGYCHNYAQVGVVCTRACTSVQDCPSGWACNMMGRCRPPG